MCIRDSVYVQNEIPLKAAGISYYIFFSLIPVTATFVSLVLTLPWLKIEAEQALILLSRWLLPDAIHEVESHFKVFAEHAGVVSLTGLGATAWFLGKIIFFMEGTMDRVWKIESKKSAVRLVKKSLLACVLATLAIGLGLAVSGHGGTSTLVQVASAWVFFLGFNRALPSQPVSWKRILPGSILGGSAWYVTKWGFTAYLSHFAKADQLYAFLGVLPLFFLWLYWSVLILFMSVCIGFTLGQLALERGSRSSS